MLTFLLGRQSGCQELNSLAQRLAAAQEKMVARSKSAQKVGETLYALVQSEAPSFAVFFERIRDIYTKLSLNYETASKEQSRAIDDLNDIVARTPVFERISAERESAKKHYDVIQKTYREAKLRSQNQPSQEATIAYQNSRIERARLASILIEKTEAFLSYRTRFTKFVQSRSQSAWLRYGKSIERASKVESELMEELAGLCKRLRDNVDTPHLILQTAEQGAAELQLADPFAEEIPPAVMDEEEEEADGIDDGLVIVSRIPDI
jgi:hypothetical protein